MNAEGRWNHNIHYHSLILHAAPERCERALDIGCGEGLLARELRGVAAHVTGIDCDRASIERARSQGGGQGIDYVLGDVLTHPFEPKSFDLVASVATLHHMESAAGLARMRELVRPGGTVAVIGLARLQLLPSDLAWVLAGAVATRLYKARKGYWEHRAPTVWPPPETYAEVCRVAERVLPRVRYRRHLLFRYSLVWTRPH